MGPLPKSALRVLPGAFTADGILPPGDYALTLDELATSMLTTGPTGGAASWDGDWRRQLVENLGVLVKQLWQIGVMEIFADGSFVEDKDHPNDIDGYFVCDVRQLASGELERSLNLLDPLKCWTWDPAQRRPFPGYPKRQLPMWHAYRVELYPHFGQGTGICDQYGHELEFPSAFRQSRRDGKPRGIIQIIRGTP
jgi:hypothetical protein